MKTTFRQAQPAVGNRYQLGRFKLAITGELPTQSGPRVRKLFVRIDCKLCARTGNKAILYMRPSDVVNFVLRVDRAHECFNGTL